MIETERLRLRPFTPADLDLIETLYSDGELLRYSPFDVMSHAQAEAHLARIVADWTRAPLRSLEFAMVRRPREPREGEEEKIGRCHILIDPETDTGMIGWFLRREHWGQGYARESGRALIRYCFEVLGLHRVNALCHPENLASQRALEACGLRREGWFRQRCRYTKGGVAFWQDELEYAVLAWETGAEPGERGSRPASPGPVCPKKQA